MLFAGLQYPYTIRADAITAVGAPSSVAFLIRAIFWLYLVVKSYYKSADSQIVLEISEHSNISSIEE